MPATEVLPLSVRRYWNRWREVREASARAGYYTMLAPVEVGGGGLGFEALYRCWETVYRRCGPHYWLGYHALAHWARGPGRLLLAMTQQAQTEVAPGLLRGTTTLCFGMSELGRHWSVTAAN